MLADRYVSSLMYSAQLKSRSGNWLGSLAIYRQIVQERPDFGPAYCELARLYLGRDDFDGARNMVRKAIKTAPGNAEAHFLLGVIEYIEGNFEAALKAYRHVERIDGPDCNLAMNIALVCEALGLKGEAIKHLEYAVARSEAGARVYGVLADLYNAVGDPARAVRVLEMAARKFPSDAQVQSALGRAYIRVRNFTRAVITIEKACRLAPKDVASLKELARLYTELDRIEDTASALLRLVKHDWENVENWLKLARVYCALGERKKSVEILEEARQFFPGNASIKDELAYVTTQLEDWQEAPARRREEER